MHFWYSRGAKSFDGDGGLQLSFKLSGEGGLLLILKFNTTTKKEFGSLMA